jgi:hypothetical protein
VIFDRYEVSVVGAIPMQTPSGASKLTFRIEGKVDIATVRSVLSQSCEGSDGKGYAGERIGLSS